MTGWNGLNAGKLLQKSGFDDCLIHSIMRFISLINSINHDFGTNNGNNLEQIQSCQVPSPPQKDGGLGLGREKNPLKMTGKF